MRSAAVRIGSSLEIVWRRGHQARPATRSQYCLTKNTGTGEEEIELQPHEFLALRDYLAALRRNRRVTAQGSPAPQQIGAKVISFPAPGADRSELA